MALTAPSITFPVISIVCTGSVQRITTDDTIWYSMGYLTLDALQSDGTTAATPIRFTVSSSTPGDITTTNGIMLSPGTVYTMPFDQRMRDNTEQALAADIYIKGAANNVVHFTYAKRT